MFNKRLFIFLFLIGNVFSFSLFAQNRDLAGGFKQFADYYHFTLWDTDDEAGGRFLSRSEFLMGFNYSNLYNIFNTERAIGISREAVMPITSDLFAGLDNDKNGIVSETEFIKYAITDSGVFRLLNRDGQSGLTQEEFTTGLFSYWNQNADDYLQEQELINGIFDLVDLNKDGQISIFELSSFGGN